LNGYYIGEKIEYDSTPYGTALERIQRSIDGHDLLIGFNLKFDLAWLRRYGIKITKPIWDLQYAYFCMTGQEVKLPSLNSLLMHYNLPLKYDVVKNEYWDKGLDTTDVPFPILDEYCRGDCEGEYQCFLRQVEDLKDKPKLKKLIWTGCQDILVTQEMEHNGMYFDIDLSLKLGKEIEEQIEVLDLKLKDIMPYDYINWNSNDHVSAVLYGGIVKHDVRETYEKTLKSGRTVQKEHWIVKEEHFEKLVEPLKGTNLAKEGFYEVNEGVLKLLKAYGKAKQLISIILERKKLEKKLSTYFKGFPELYKEMDWKDSILHGQLNHCITVTGRLSSNKPNQQNLDEEIRKCFQTRFK
jgi:DNA polymerase I-like protein with 3'-5' exonuclease and polymerase domains